MAENEITMERTQENERVVLSGTGKIYLRRHDPYGFWHVSFESGPTPEKLSSAFTTLDFAFETIKNYIENNYKRQLQIKETADRERVKNAKTKFEEKHAE